MTPKELRNRVLPGLFDLAANLGRELDLRVEDDGQVILRMQIESVDDAVSIFRALMPLRLPKATRHMLSSPEQKP